MKFDNILVPVDFSEFSDKAVAYALYLAETHGSNLTLLHAVVLHQEDVEEEAHLLDYEELVKKKEAQIQRKMAGHNEQAGRRGVKINAVTVRGIFAADTILDYIDDHDFDLVVIGTHGRTGLNKWLHGSVAEKVVRVSPVPVLSIHQNVTEYRIGKILVPVDFSDYARQAVEAALGISRQFDARLEFLFVLEQDLHPAFYAGGVGSLFTIDAELKQRTTDRLREFVGYTGENAAYRVLEGRAFNEIVETASSEDCDLIVMATRGLTGLEHLLIGSTTERVVRFSTVPVLTVGRNKSFEDQ